MNTHPAKTHRVTLTLSARLTVCLPVTAEDTPEAAVEALDAFAALRRDQKPIAVELPDGQGELCILSFDEDAGVQYISRLGVPVAAPTASAGEAETEPAQGTLIDGLGQAAFKPRQLVRYFAAPGDETPVKTLEAEDEPAGKHLTELVLLDDFAYGYAELYDQTLERVILKAQAKRGGLGVRAFDRAGHLVAEDYWLMPTVQRRVGLTLAQRDNVHRVQWVDFTDRQRGMVVTRELGK